MTELPKPRPPFDSLANELISGWGDEDVQTWMVQEVLGMIRVKGFRLERIGSGTGSGR